MNRRVVACRSLIRLFSTSLPIPLPLCLNSKVLLVNKSLNSTKLSIHTTVKALNTDDFDNDSRPSEGELKLIKILKDYFPKASVIKVNDISGGCGSMYQIQIESVEFKGLPIRKQHMLVNTALKDEIAKMHGLRIFTSLPEVKK
jgi:BolA-like protein 3